MFISSIHMMTSAAALTALTAFILYRQSISDEALDLICVANVTWQTVLAVDGADVDETTVAGALNRGNASTCAGSPHAHDTQTTHTRIA
jgi:hypothetical protein